MRAGTQHRRGSTMVLTVIISIVISGLVITMCWLAGESSQRTSALSKLDQAFFAAEAGAQRVQWYCKNNKMSAITSPLTGTINGDTYSVSWSTVSGSTILIKSVGSSGSVCYTLSEQVTPPSAAPAISSGGGFDNKNIDVFGNVVVAGAYNNGGTGSVTGNLTYYGSASNTGSVSGTVTQASSSFTPIDMSALGSTLMTAAGRTYIGDQSNVTFDFTTVVGTNKVIYVSGNVTNPNFVGSGTLYATGAVSIGSAGTAANPVHVVAQGDITTTNNSTHYGDLYTGGTWYRGKFMVTGLVYAARGVDTSNYAQSTLIQGTAPWFDPRATSWSTTMVTTSFSGPQP